MAGKFNADVAQLEFLLQHSDDPYCPTINVILTPANGPGEELDADSAEKYSGPLIALFGAYKFWKQTDAAVGAEHFELTGEGPKLQDALERLYHLSVESGRKRTPGRKPHWMCRAFVPTEGLASRPIYRGAIPRFGDDGRGRTSPVHVFAKVYQRKGHISAHVNPALEAHEIKFRWVDDGRELSCDELRRIVNAQIIERDSMRYNVHYRVKLLAHRPPLVADLAPGADPDGHTTLADWWSPEKYYFYATDFEFERCTHDLDERFFVGFVFDDALLESFARPGAIYREVLEMADEDDSHRCWQHIEKIKSEKDPALRRSLLREIFDVRMTVDDILIDTFDIHEPQGGFWLSGVIPDECRQTLGRHKFRFHVVGVLPKRVTRFPLRVGALSQDVRFEFDYREVPIRAVHAERMMHAMPGKPLPALVHNEKMRHIEIKHDSYPLNPGTGVQVTWSNGSI